MLDENLNLFLISEKFLSDHFPGKCGTLAFSIGLSMKECSSSFTMVSFVHLRQMTHSSSQEFTSGPSTSQSYRSRSLSSTVTVCFAGKHFKQLGSVDCPCFRGYVLSGPVFGILLLFSVLFASALPLSCRLYLYADMERAYAAEPNITDRLACSHAGQIPYMNMDVRKRWFALTLRAICIGVRTNVPFKFTLETLIPVSVAAMITTYTYTIVCICSYKIWRKLKSQAGTMSRKTVSLNKQLNSMLLVQVRSGSPDETEAGHLLSLGPVSICGHRDPAVHDVRRDLQWH